MNHEEVRRLGVRLSRAETIPDQVSPADSPSDSPQCVRSSAVSRTPSCNSSVVNKPASLREPQFGQLWAQTDDQHRSKLNLDTKLDLNKSSSSINIPRWLLVFLVVFPLSVAATAALIVFGILPLLSLQHDAPSPSSAPDKTDKAQPSAVVYTEREDAYIRLLVGVTVGSILLLLFFVGGIAICLLLRRKTYAIDEGLLDGVALRDGSVTLTRLNTDKGEEYRVDLSSGELDTAVEDNKSLASFRESVSSKPSLGRESVSSKPSDGSLVIERHENKRGSVRNSSYKRAVEGRSVYEYQNRPMSVLFDVNKYINNRPVSKTQSLHSSGLESIPQSPSNISAPQSPIPPSSRDIPISTDSTLVNSQVHRIPSYGTLGKSRLLSSVDDEGYHFDNLGFIDEAKQADDSAFEDTPSDQITGAHCQLGKEEFGDNLPISQSPGDAEDRYILEAVDKLEKDLQTSPKFGPILAGFSSSPNIASTSPSGDSITLRSKSFDKILTKQDSFQGLPDQRSFDKYLSLVRLDSTTSLLAPVSEELPASTDEPSLSSTAVDVPAVDMSLGTSNTNIDRQMCEKDMKEQTDEDKRQGVVFDKLKE